jgi:hypothetical protein
MKKYTISTFLALAVAVSLANMKELSAKIIYENELENQNTAQVQAVPQVRPSLPQVQAGQPQAMSAQPLRDPINDLQQQAPSSDAETLSRAELLRRQRLRVEMKNEDILAQKLEEMRIRDELNRQAELSSMNLQQNPQTKQEQPLVVQPVGEAAKAKSIQNVSAVSKEPAQEELNAKSIAQAQVEKNDEEDNTKMIIIPRAGMSGITNTGYDLQSNITAGISLGADISDYVSFLLGYSYSDFNFAFGNNQYYYGMMAVQRMRLQDHVFDAGVRANFLPSKAKFRPFVGGGFGYRRAYLNFDQQTLNLYSQYYPGLNLQDVQLSSLLGYIEAGVDFKLTKMLSLGGSLKYFTSFNSRINNPLNPFGYAGYGDVRNQAATTISDSSFYQLLIGLSIHL